MEGGLKVKVFEFGRLFWVPYGQAQQHKSHKSIARKLVEYEYNRR